MLECVQLYGTYSVFTLEEPIFSLEFDKLNFVKVLRRHIPYCVYLRLFDFISETYYGPVVSLLFCCTF